MRSIFLALLLMLPFIARAEQDGLPPNSSIVQTDLLYRPFGNESITLTSTFKPAPVGLHLRYTRGDTTGHGTAFSIGGNLLLTAAHNVLKSPGQTQKDVVVWHVNQWVKTSLVRYDLNADIALLKVDVSFPGLHLSEYGMDPGQTVTVSGAMRDWPVANYEGTVEQIIRFGTDCTEIKVPFDHGLSGAPVLNQKGELVGMAVAGIPDKDGEMDHERGLALPLRAIKDFLENRAPVKTEETVSETKRFDPPHACNSAFKPAACTASGCSSCSRKTSRKDSSPADSSYPSHWSHLPE